MADDDNLWAVAARQAHAQAAPAAPAGGGGKFEMSEQQLDSLVKRLDDVAQKVQSAITDAYRMVDIKPPGNDPHSQRVAQVMNESGDAYMTSLRNQLRAVNGMRDAMQKALDSYRGVEHHNSDTVRQVSQGLQGGI